MESALSGTRLAFVDLETTGATAASDRITEIGIVAVEADGSFSEWSALVDPEVPISPFIERLTGISNAMVAGQPRFADLAAEVRERLAGRLFIAHNARFDYGFLKAEFARAGLDFRATVLCTVKLSRRLQPQHHRHNLDALIARHGLVADGRHRALADARLIHQLWQRLHATIPAPAIANAVAELTATPHLPPQIDAASVEELPEGWGVYVLHGEQGALWVGRNRNLRKRVLSHFGGRPADAREARIAGEIAAHVRRIEARRCAGEIGAQLLEARLLRELKPVHNRPATTGDEAWTWRLASVAGGRLTPELVAVEDCDFGVDAALYGLFNLARDARRALQQIARDQELCLLELGLEDARRDAAGCLALERGGCRGACVGRETPASHAARLLAGLTRLKLQPWPFAGPALLREGETLHVVDRWRHLGSADSDDGVFAALETRPPSFDREAYRILVRQAAKLQPLRR